MKLPIFIWGDNLEMPLYQQKSEAFKPKASFLRRKLCICLSHNLGELNRIY